ncbi:GntR family transcriptional regulator [Lentilactobacillus hilgardii]|nr:FCD domain-containing protein [Lentilactobacillus hilgardii]MCV3739833.1 GntR family transcriptional regulator [Lentilactobacillus hilgardii]
MAKISVYQQTVDKLQKNIINGSWKPGQRLPTMKQLAKEVGVSITTMREALKSLENQNVISIEHGRGIYVRNDPNSLNVAGVDKVKSLSLLSLLRARLLVEPEQAYLCAKNGDRNITEELQNLSERMDKEMRVGGDFLNVDLEFHQLVAEGANQPALRIMSSSLEKYQIESRERTNTLPNMRTKASLYHQLIATAVATNDADEAKELMKMHIETMLDPLEKMESD